MKRTVKKVISKLSPEKQKSIKKLYFRHQIRNERFVPDEKEFDLINDWIEQGDWVIDVGANVGHYTKKFSELVGESGRVVAFEPIPFTFDILCSNVHEFTFGNVTLMNAAVSDATKIVSMDIPLHRSGLKNYYMANVSDSNGDLKILSIPLDSMFALNSIKLVKIDAEGHELYVLKGMKDILKKFKPIIIAENSSNNLYSYLKHYGYTSTQLQNSPNIIFT